MAQCSTGDNVAADSPSTSQHHTMQEIQAVRHFAQHNGRPPFEYAVERIPGGNNEKAAR